MFIELHMIQNFAPSNLNRDDTNNPKDCVFGGARRARISSQCLKRAIRTAPSFADTVGTATGIRSRLIAGELRNRFITQNVGEADARTVAEALALVYTKRDKKGKKDKSGAEGRRALLRGRARAYWSTSARTRSICSATGSLRSGMRSAMRSRRESRLRSSRSLRT